MSLLKVIIEQDTPIDLFANKQMGQIPISHPIVSLFSPKIQSNIDLNTKLVKNLSVLSRDITAITNAILKAASTNNIPPGTTSFIDVKQFLLDNYNYRHIADNTWNIFKPLIAEIGATSSRVNSVFGVNTLPKGRESLVIHFYKVFSRMMDLANQIDKLGRRLFPAMVSEISSWTVPPAPTPSPMILGKTIKVGRTSYTNPLRRSGGRMLTIGSFDWRGIKNADILYKLVAKILEVNNVLPLTTVYEAASLKRFIVVNDDHSAIIVGGRRLQDFEVFLNGYKYSSATVRGLLMVIMSAFD